VIDAICLAIVGFARFGFVPPSSSRWVTAPADGVEIYAPSEREVRKRPVERAITCSNTVRDEATEHDDRNDRHTHADEGAEMKLAVRGIPSDHAERVRRGGADANGQPALTRVSRGASNPCRHCLGLIAEGDEMLVLAYRPFDGIHPYAEVGPIFLHGASCDRYVGDALPGWLDHGNPMIIRGYDADEEIRYETGSVVPGHALTASCRRILEDESVAYVHIRSRYNCFQCRVDRGPS
jgi:hypothetical protein